MDSSDEFGAPVEHWSASPQRSQFEPVVGGEVFIPPLPAVSLVPMVKEAELELARPVNLSRLVFATPSFRQASTPPTELVTSIQRYGFWGALIGRQRGTKVELAFGRRRVEAAQLLKMDSIPVQIRELDDATFYWLGLEEAFLQSNLNPLEEAQALATALQRPAASPELLAQRLGRSTVQIAERLLLVKYPDVEQALREDLIDVATACELAQINDKAMRARFLRQWQASGKKAGRIMVVSLETPYQAVPEVVPAPVAEIKPQSDPFPSDEEDSLESLQKLIAKFSQQLNRFDFNAINDNPKQRKPARKMLRYLLEQVQQAENSLRKSKDD